MTNSKLSLPSQRYQVDSSGQITCSYRVTHGGMIGVAELNLGSPTAQQNQTLTSGLQQEKVKHYCGAPSKENRTANT